MSDDKWFDLIEQIEQKFEILERYTTEDDMTDDTGKTYKGTKETVIFEGLQGRIKLERVTHPFIIDKKMHYHKGSGGTANIEYTVSETEKTHKLLAYLYDTASDNWKELDIPGEMKF